MPGIGRSFRPSGAMVVAWVALFFAFGGVGYAQKVVRLISGSQIKKGSIDLSRLSQAARTALKGNAGLQGAQGPRGLQGAQGLRGDQGLQGAQGLRGDQGPQGATGNQGPSHGYSTSFNTPVTLEAAGTQHILMSLNVPNGNYMVIARLQGRTGTDGDGVTKFRYDCALAGAGVSIDSPLYRVGITNGVENYLTYEGGYSGVGPITLTCSSGNNNTLEARTGSMVAVAVGGLN